MAMEDQAQIHEIKEWEARNRASTEPLKYTPKDAGYGPKECKECDDPMPKERREHGFRLCVHCATLIEQRDKQRRR